MNWESWPGLARQVVVSQVVPPAVLVSSGLLPLVVSRLVLELQVTLVPVLVLERGETPVLEQGRVLELE